jgi:MFS family permease
VKRARPQATSGSAGPSNPERPRAAGGSASSGAAAGALPSAPGVPRNVVALGFVSLFTDISSEMIIPVLPLFVTVTLRAPVAGLGVIEGVAECTATVLRVASGWLSDRVGSRKPFLVFGYGLSAVAKAALALAASWGAVLGLRFVDRVGKGLRNPPRDALIAESVEPGSVGRAFGLHRAMDTLGAAIGPLAAFALLTSFPGDFRRIFLLSLLPAALSIVVLLGFVRAPRHEPRALRTFHREFRALGGPYHRFVLVAGLFALASSSTAFLLLYAKRAGFVDRAIPLVYLVYNLVYALLSWPIGALSDRIGRRAILFVAYALFAGIYGLLAWHGSRAGVVAGFLLLGVHSALLEGSQRSMIADLVPEDRRATAYGMYYAIVGLALLPASVIAGAVWDRFGPQAALGLDAVLALAAALLFALLLPLHAERGDRHAATA